MRRFAKACVKSVLLPSLLFDAARSNSDGTQSEKKMVELVAAHTYMEPKFYFSEEVFRRKIESVFMQIDAKRAKYPDGTHMYPAVACFPEDIGTFNTLGEMPFLSRRAKTTKGLITAACLVKLPSFLWQMIRHRTCSTNEAAFLLTARRTHRIFFSTFSDFARKYNMYVCAGSALLPANLLGDNTPEMQPASHHVFNTSYTFDPIGNCINVVRKVNLVPTIEDVLSLSPGIEEENVIMDLPFGRTAVAICYDGFVKPHTTKEPDFERLCLRYDKEGAQILLQPSANPWYWNQMWMWNRPGMHMLRKDQWLKEGLFATMQEMTGGVRYAVNSQLIAQILEVHMDAKSYIFEREVLKGTNKVKIIAESARADINPSAEEVVMATVPWCKT